jgi:hypothetical protein
MLIKLARSFPDGCFDIEHLWCYDHSSMNARKQFIQKIVVDILWGREDIQHYPPRQLDQLEAGVYEVIQAKDTHMEGDKLLVHEVFWDLIYQRVLTLGIDLANREFPFFRLHSDFEDNIAKISP